MSKVSPLFLTDVTLRDGSHAIRHRYGISRVRDIARALDAAGVDAIEIGHGDGLGGSSVANGLSRHTDFECFEATALAVRRAKLATIIIPGIGTRQDLRRAADAGVAMVRVATYCTQADLSAQLISEGRTLGLHVSGFLMMGSAAPPEEIARQAAKMEGYGAQCVYIADSAGNMTMADVEERFQAMEAILSPTTKRGIHAHENLSLSVANSIKAVEHGAVHVDASLAGMGAGAGNCPIEAFVAVANRLGWNHGCDLYRLQDAAEDLVRPLQDRPVRVDRQTLTLGYAGVYACFLRHAEDAARKNKLDVRDIMVEVGRIGLVVGQEDLIADVAADLRQRHIAVRKIEATSSTSHSAQSVQDKGASPLARCGGDGDAPTGMRIVG